MLWTFLTRISDWIFPVDEGLEEIDFDGFPFSYKQILEDHTEPGWNKFVYFDEKLEKELEFGDKTVEVAKGIRIIQRLPVELTLQVLHLLTVFQILQLYHHTDCPELHQLANQRIYKFWRHNRSIYQIGRTKVERVYNWLAAYTEVKYPPNQDLLTCNLLLLHTFQYLAKSRHVYEIEFIVNFNCAGNEVVSFGYNQHLHWGLTFKLETTNIDVQQTGRAPIRTVLSLSSDQWMTKKIRFVALFYDKPSDNLYYIQEDRLLKMFTVFCMPLGGSEATEIFSEPASRRARVAISVEHDHLFLLQSGWWATICVTYYNLQTKQQERREFGNWPVRSHKQCDNQLLIECEGRLIVFCVEEKMKIIWEQPTDCSDALNEQIIGFKHGSEIKFVWFNEDRQLTIQTVPIECNRNTTFFRLSNNLFATRGYFWSVKYYIHELLDGKIRCNQIVRRSK